MGPLAAASAGVVSGDPAALSSAAGTVGMRPAAASPAPPVSPVVPVSPVSPGELARAVRAARGGRSAGPRAVARAYLALTKPRIIELLLVTTVPAMLLAAGARSSAAPPGATSGGGTAAGSTLAMPWLVAVVLVAGSLAAGAANALNCYLDRDIDQVMRRTARRPLPAHRVTPLAALIFGLALAVVSVLLMAVFTNPLATGLTLGAIVYYDVVYTLWLKRTTWQNTVWGGVCGAAPVLIGWSAVTGSLSAPAWVLFAVVFLWQPPHFYALAIKFRDDYARAGIPMLPVVAATRRVTLECLVYAVLTALASLALWPLGMTPVYGAVAVLAGAAFVLEAYRLDRRARRGEKLAAMRLFHWSTTYLTILSVAVAVDALI